VPVTNCKEAKEVDQSPKIIQRHPSMQYDFEILNDKCKKTYNCETRSFHIIKQVNQEEFKKIRENKCCLENIVGFFSYKENGKYYFDMNAGSFDLEHLIGFFEHCFSLTKIKKFQKRYYGKNLNLRTQFNFLKMIIIILKDILQGLQTLYEKCGGRYHWDVKPQNVVFDFDFFLIDFETSNCQPSLNHPVRNSAGYTKGYVAPERFDYEKNCFRENETIYDPFKCDIYSLGIILKRLLLLTPKFEKESNDLSDKIYCFLENLATNLSSIDPDIRKSRGQVLRELEEFKDIYSFQREKIYDKMPLNEIKNYAFSMISKKDSKKEMVLSITEKLKKIYKVDMDGIKALSNYKFLIFNNILNKRINSLIMDSSFFNDHENNSEKTFDYFCKMFLEIQLNLGEDPLYFYNVYSLKIITKGLYYETLAHFYYNLDRTRESKKWYKRSFKEYGRSKDYINQLKIRIYIIKVNYLLKLPLRVDHFMKLRKEILENETILNYNSSDLQFINNLYYSALSLRFYNGNKKKSKNYYLKALGLLEDNLGRNHPSTLKLRIDFFTQVLLFSQEEIHENYHDLTSKVEFKRDTLNEILLKVNYAVILNRIGKITEAIKILKEAITKAKSINIRNSSPLMIRWNYYLGIFSETINNSSTEALSYFDQNEIHFSSEYNYKVTDKLRNCCAKIKIKSKEFSRIKAKICKGKEEEDQKKKELRKLEDECQECIDASFKILNCYKIIYVNVVGYVYMNIASFQRDIKDNKLDAIKYYLKAREYYSQLGEKSDYPLFCDVLIAELWCQLGNYKNALKYIQLPLREYPKIYTEEHPRIKKTNEVYEAIKELTIQM